MAQRTHDRHGGMVFQDSAYERMRMSVQDASSRASRRILLILTDPFSNGAREASFAARWAYLLR